MRPGQRGQGGEGRFPTPLFRVLDKDANGVLSEAEIKHASKALMTLDKNGDRSLSRIEVFGHRGPGAGQAGDATDGPRRGPAGERLDRAGKERIGKERAGQEQVDPGATGVEPDQRIRRNGRSQEQSGTGSAGVTPKRSDKKQAGDSDSNPQL